MTLRRVWTPATTRLLQLAATLLAVLYMLLIGGTFDATLRFRVQLLNFVLGTGLAGLWLAGRLWARRPWRPTGLELPLLVYAATQLVAVVTAVQPRLTLEPFATLVTWCVALLILYDLLAQGWPREFIENALIVAAVVLAGHGLWSAGAWYVQWARLGQLPPVTLRYYGLFTDPNLTACLINLLLPLIIVRTLRDKSWARLAWLALVLGLVLTEFFTSSRAGWIACGVMLAALVGLLLYTPQAQQRLSSWWQRWRQRGLPAQLAGLGLVLAAVIVGSWLLARQSQHLTHGALLDSRQQFWSAAWDLFVQRPLTGVGPDLFGWFYSRYESIPPDFFAPHAHSLPLQILSGSGLLGFAGLLLLVAVASVLLVKTWLARGRPLPIAACLAGLVGFGVQHLFHYLVGTPFVPFLLVNMVALALAPPTDEPPSAGWSPLRLAPALLVPIGLLAFALNAAQWNDAGLQKAARDDWPGAAAAFQRAGQLDPGLTLYWEEAAFARAQAGDLSLALALWRRAAHDDPYWAVAPASSAAVGGTLAEAAAAQRLAPRSYLFALNAGAVAEAAGAVPAAQQAYQTALDLKPTAADALYWQQTALRRAALASWQTTQPIHTTILAQAWTALGRGAADQAAALFQQAMASDPNDLSAYLGLGQAYLNTHQPAAAERVAQAGLALPTDTLEATLGLHLLVGDLAEARGDQAAATNEYALVFSAVDAYNIDGPGTYGYTNRSWQVYRREALPGELVPPLLHADITPQMDQRFAQLAQWYRADQQATLACWILGRVHQDAPDSISGALYQQQCLAAAR